MDQTIYFVNIFFKSDNLPGQERFPDATIHSPATLW